MIFSQVTEQGEPQKSSNNKKHQKSADEQVELSRIQLGFESQMDEFSYQPRDNSVVASSFSSFANPPEKDEIHELVFQNQALLDLVKINSKLTMEEQQAFVSKTLFQSSNDGVDLSLKNLIENRYSSDILSRTFIYNSPNGAVNLTFQRDEIVFNNKKSILINFREVKIDGQVQVNRDQLKNCDQIALLSQLKISMQTIVQACYLIEHAGAQSPSTSAIKDAAVLSLLKVQGSAEVARTLDGRSSRIRSELFSMHQLVCQTINLMEHAIEVENAKVFFQADDRLDRVQTDKDLVHFLLVTLLEAALYDTKRESTVHVQIEGCELEEN